MEEGAEEFFLKPVQLSDLKKLRPHLMKTKLKDQNLEETKEKQQQQQQEIIKGEEEIKEKEEEQQGFLEPEILLQDHQQIPNNNNKRKGMDESLSSPDSRTRPRYTELASVV